MEQYKTIPGHPNYEVSNNAMVFSNRSGIRIQLNGTKQLNGSQGFTIDKRFYGLHQLVAMTFLDYNPCGKDVIVEHVDENKQNNNVSNLRLVSKINILHKKKSNRTSMFKGVYFHFNNSKYVALICFNGTSKYLGSFDCHIRAHLEYLKAYKLANKN